MSGCRRRGEGSELAFGEVSVSVTVDGDERQCVRNVDGVAGQGDVVEE